MLCDIDLHEPYMSGFFPCVFNFRFVHSKSGIAKKFDTKFVFAIPLLPTLSLRMRSSPQHHLACRKRRLNRAVLWMKPVLYIDFLSSRKKTDLSQLRISKCPMHYIISPNLQSQYRISPGRKNRPGIDPPPFLFLDFNARNVLLYGSS
jgi:hypothetical protein